MVLPVEWHTLAINICVDCADNNDTWWVLLMPAVTDNNGKVFQLITK